MDGHRSWLNGGYDVVLVAAETINSLREAYPNYFADTDEFINTVIGATNGGQRSKIQGNRKRLGIEQLLPAFELAVSRILHFDPMP
jgi:hypothetical protein